MELRVLGPVELRVAGRRVAAGPPRQRGMLAALAVDAGRPVPIDTLIDRVWGDAAPDQARNALHACVTRARRVLDRATAAGGTPALLVRQAGGYVLEIDPNSVDVHRFRTLIERARDPGCPDPRRVDLLRQALDLWWGTPLANLTGDWAERMRATWGQQRLDAALWWAEAELRLDHSGAVIGRLTELTAEYPLVESLVAVLMRALHAAGRSAEALDCYARTRERLAKELGVDPGPELRELHTGILRGEVATSSPVPRPAPAGAVPAQLPLDVRGFTGRVEQLAELDAFRSAATGQPTAVPIVALWGTPGVGKTALAVHWAHRVTPQFPDGQLYANLRGFDPTETVTSPPDALRGFLDALGVPPDRIPATLDAQINRYRTLLAGKRVLIVLDNARDAEQVRPLLPGAPGCLVVVTSRTLLTSLVAVEGAHPMTLDPLPAGEAHELLTRRLGRDRVAKEPAAVNEIIARCARLPLALAIVAARTAATPGRPLAALAGELGDARAGLDSFTGGDPATDLRAVFSWSYRALCAPAARLFRLLGLHPGPDVTVAAAASLAALPAAEADAALFELAHAHLVVQHAPGRYAFHDLLRAYAIDRTEALDSAAERRAAMHRMLDHYLHSARAADTALQPHRDPPALPPPEPGTTIVDVGDGEQATAWFGTERPVLLGVLERAAAAGFDQHVWQLAWAMTTFVNRRGYGEDQVTVQRLALSAAQRLDDPLGQAHAHRGLARGYGQLGRYEQAHRHFQLARELFARLENIGLEATTHLNAAWVYERQGDVRAALEQAQQAHQLYLRGDDRVGLANALNGIGWYHAQLGDHQAALESCGQALVLLEELGDRYGHAFTLDSIGYAHHHLGHHEQAITCFQRALDLFRDLGDRYREAEVLHHLGDTLQESGDLDAAGRVWREAADILQQLDHPDVDQIRAKLRRIDQLAARAADL
jgi:DNA-binding SARP family transcriptional activator/tetratricopeptide (TPR) repeat protein